MKTKLTTLLAVLAAMALCLTSSSARADEAPAKTADGTPPATPRVQPAAAMQAQTASKLIKMKAGDAIIAIGDCIVKASTGQEHPVAQLVEITIYHESTLAVTGLTQQKDGYALKMKDGTEVALKESDPKATLRDHVLKQAADKTAGAVIEISPQIIVHSKIMDAEHMKQLTMLTGVGATATR